MGNYQFRPSPNSSSRKGNDVDGIIIHYTAGGSTAGTIKWFQMEQAKASAHYVIARNGKITQMIQENRAAWHAGSSATKPMLHGRGSLNLWTIGIEISNWGNLYKCTQHEAPVTLASGARVQRAIGEIYTRYRRWTHPYSGDSPRIHATTTEVMKRNKYWPGDNTVDLWEPYQSPVLQAVEILLNDILDRHPHIARDFIVGHSDVDPTRKLDPGPAFPFKKILDSIFPEEESSTDNFKIDRRNNEHATIEEMKDMYEPREEIIKKPFFFW